MKMYTRTLLATAVAAVLVVPMLSDSHAALLSGPPLPKAAAETLDGPTDRLVVKFRDGSTGVAAAAANGMALSRAAAAAGIDAKPSHRLAVGADVVTLSRKLDRVEVDAMLNNLRADPAVEYAIVDRMLKPTFVPNDPQYGSQWHYNTAPGGLNLETAWNTARGVGIVVAVLDTGITDHSDLDARILPGWDFISTADVGNDGNGRDGNPDDPGDWVTTNECGSNAAQDSSWHGTHVAGTIAAVTHNAEGVAGVAHKARVVPVRVLGKCGGYTSDIADAIVWASGGAVAGAAANAYPAEVINMSLGGGGSCDPLSQAAIDVAIANGTTVVVAAGNSNSTVENFSPASCDGVVTVASNDLDMGRSGFSNAGNGIEVAAPGGSPGILSTINTGTTVPVSEDFGYMQGTSMASPHVAGVVALMQSLDVNTPAQITEILARTATKIPGAECPGLCGGGRVDVVKALDAVNGAPLPALPPVTLRNGVSSLVTAGGAGSEQHFVLSTYSGAAKLNFNLSAGTGNADMYVNFGSKASLADFDCAATDAGNTGTCSFPTPSVGHYYVMVRGAADHSGAKVSGKHVSRIFVNKTPIHIPDVGDFVSSPIFVYGRAGNAPATTKVSVTVYHTWSGDLELELRAPDGTIYPLQANVGGSADHVITSYVKDLSSEVANGTWNLRVKDESGADIGHIGQWSMTF